MKDLPHLARKHEAPQSCGGRQADAGARAARVAPDANGNGDTHAAIPHPIPYQGSKRRLAPRIAAHFPAGIDRLIEPFAGSAAITLYAARHSLARRFVIGDSLPAIVELWRGIIEHPEETACRYRELWSRQHEHPQHYLHVRERWNRERDAVDLLYLICRCVKNAVRFNARGEFTQSADRRRAGMHPDRMRVAIEGASTLLRGRVELRCGDWMQTGDDANARDFVYLDPPYLGTSIGRDKRYHRQLARESIVEGLEILRARHVPFALSYDGATGGKSYGPPLPAHLRLTRLLLDAGRSAQATLSGRSERTFESLYLSHPRNAGAAHAADKSAYRAVRDTSKAVAYHPEG